MKISKKIKLLLFTPFICGGVMAQTVNEGGLYISPGVQFSTLGDLDNKSGATFTNDGEVFIYANYNNDGVFNFTPGALGLTRFEGPNIQQLSGSNTSYFHNIMFNNSFGGTSSFELSGTFNIANSSDFTNGIVDNSNWGGLLIFGNSATHSNTSDLSYVNGSVEKIGNTSFNYPIGAGSYYRPSIISAPSDINDAFKAKYYFENPNLNYPLANKEAGIELIDNQEYWEVTRDNGSSNVLLTLSWDEFTTTPQAVVSEGSETIHIVRWDVDTQQWMDEGGLVDIANRTVTTLVGLEKYGVFTIAVIKPESDIVASQGVSPNGDGMNEVFFIENLKGYPNTGVSIFNRWGVKVYESNDYQNDWNGISTSSLSFGDNQLPEGTYYYVIELGGGSEKVVKGYFYLKRN